MMALERIWAELDIRPVLPTIQAPTLVLHRTGDPVERVEAGRDFAARIPGASFVELAGEDWPVWAGDQDRLFDEIESFLRGLREEEAELDRVLATVLFTDIASSTEKATKLGDRAWRELVERHAGGKTSGIAVNIAARVAALAETSEVLVSRTVKDLVAGSGLGFIDGSRRLRGIEGSWHLYAVAADGA